MNCVCPHCDTELELVDVESFQPEPDAEYMNIYYSYSCPTCGREYHSVTNYQKSFSTDIYEKE